MIRRKTCACCGEFAGRWEQWHNQDTGYGLCRRCVLMIRTKMERPEFEQTYGRPGVHYMEPGTAQEMADLQRRYDRLHHERRAFELGARESEGLTHWERELLKNSRLILSLPAQGFHSVDINDAEKLAELDAWVKGRLEALRIELKAERISYGELAELQSLSEYIDPGDVELLEAAGVPEQGASN